MKILLLILTFFWPCLSLAQTNLVPNPSFEDTISCPFNGRIYNCQYWINCGNTPDYDNSCANNPYGIPDNNFGYQAASTGKAYCNFSTYTANSMNFREYIGVSLITPLIINHNYSVSFKCSPGNRNGYSMYTNKLGIRFSTVLFDSLHSVPTDNFAHIYSDSIISDTINWTEIKGDFTADSAYSFISLGNFFDDNNTDTSNYNPLSSFFAMYYIDDIVVLDQSINLQQEEARGSIVTYSMEGNEIRFNSTKELTDLELYNTQGMKINTIYEKDKNCIKFNAKNLNKGIYIARIFYSDKFSTIKIITN